MSEILAVFENSVNNLACVKKVVTECYRLYCFMLGSDDTSVITAFRFHNSELLGALLCLGQCFGRLVS